MIYELAFHPDAWDEWQELDGSIRTPFKKKLAERLIEPRIPSAKLSGHPDRYKIKLRAVGCRLVYEVQDELILVTVMAVGRRDKQAVYRMADTR